MGRATGAGPAGPGVAASLSLRAALTGLTTVLISLLAGIASGQDAPPRVVATVGMVGDVAAEIAGECAQVEWMMGSGVDPHLYQASARDVATLQEADLILYVGHSLEGQLGEVLSGFARRTPTVAVAEEAVGREELIATDDVYGVDPHLWMDVSLWLRIVPVIAGALQQLTPDCAEIIANNAARYDAELRDLHDWVGEAIATIPSGQRLMVTAHDAFAYFGRAYGIEVMGIQGISTESEAGVADIRRMARLVADRAVPAVFVESTINPRTVQAVVDAAESLGHSVVLGEELYSDAMGSADSAGGTYIGMIHENTLDIVDGLGGEAPPLPPGLAGWAARWGLDEE